MGRTLIQATILISFFLITKKKITLKTHYPFLTLVRVVCFFFGFAFFYISLTFMSLAMVSALFFSCPFFMSMFAKFFLKEQIGIRRWSAIVVGFIGVLIVLNPTLKEFNFFKLAPVGCALCYACSMTITKYTSDKDNIYTQMFYFYLIAILLCIIIFIFMGSGQFYNSNLNPSIQFIYREWFTEFDYTWKFLLFFGFAASIAFVCIFSAYIIASPSVVSLFEYSLIIMSMIPGYFLFNEIPTSRTLLGVSFIISAGLYIYLREKIKDQYIATETPVRR